MTHLLDVSTLIALLWPSHVDHAKATAWCEGKKIAVCPISELGFIRVSTSVAFNATMDDARRTMADFLRDEEPQFVPCDIRALEGEAPPTSGKTTDWYLANLAAKHGMKWATLDTNAKHPAALVVN
jgi:predicted nucleic acid-binding protein